jgi:hypothetical protein
MQCTGPDRDRDLPPRLQVTKGPDVSNKPSDAEVLSPEVSPEGFIAFPEDFRNASPDLRNVVKIIHRPAVDGDTVVLKFYTDAMAVDFSEVDAERFNFEALAVDCDMVKRAAQESPEELRELIRQLQSGTSDGVRRSAEITERLGLTEAAAIKAGGGLSLIVVVAAVINIVKAVEGAQRQKSSSPTTARKTNKNPQ